MLVSNRISTVEHVLGKQRCTGPYKQAIGDINNLPITQTTSFTSASQLFNHYASYYSFVISKPRSRVLVQDQDQDVTQ